MAKLTDFLGRPHSGIIPHVVIGLVTDNKDPDKLGRIKVKFPMLEEEPLSYWARVATMDAGTGTDEMRGFYALPEIEDEVLVTFLHGDYNHPIILGQLWNGKQKPPAEADGGMPGSAKTDTGGSLSTGKPTDGSGNYDANDRRLWRSRSGHLFVFDDTGGAESVQIWDKGHKLSLSFDTATGTIVLASNDKDIHIRAKQHIFLEAGQDIKFKAGNNWEVESVAETKFTVGANWKSTVTQNMEVAASSNIKLEATADFSAKGLNSTVEGSIAFKGKGGATAELSASGQTTVKGGVVMIN